MILSPKGNPQANACCRFWIRLSRPLHKNRRSDNLKEYKAATNFYQWLEHKLDEAAVGLIAITSGQRFFLEYTRFVRFK